MSEIAIQVENLSKKYVIGHGQSGSLRETLSNVWQGVIGRQRSDEEEFWALRELNFDIKQGEAVGIIGRNGAGKSTLLKLLSKITYPTTGKIIMNGRVSSLLEVGTGFHPELTGRENIYLNGTILGMSRKEVKSKFDEIVDFSGVEKFLDTPVKRYSSGMYVRLAFSVAAHLEPEILIIDEVLAVGDIQFQKKCLGKMDEVTKEGRTVLFVSHNMGAIKNLCSRAILLQEGIVEFSGDINEAIREYRKDEDEGTLLNDIEISTNRKGDGRYRITKIELFKKNNQVTTTFQYRDSILFNFSFLTESSKIDDEVFLSIHFISTKSNEYITSVRQKIEFKNKESLKQVIVEFEKPLLRPGYYQLKFVLSNEEFKPHDIIESKNNPLIIETKKDIYELGFDPTSNYAGYYSESCKIVNI